MAESIFTLHGDGRYQPTEHARGPWDPRALHGGAPAALIASVFERIPLAGTGEPGSELPIARLSFEFLRPIPFAPLELSTRVVRAGKRVQELAAELRVGDLSICRASALRVQPVPSHLPPDTPSAPEALPAPAQGKPVDFALNPEGGMSFAGTGMEMRWFGDPWTLGPGAGVDASASSAAAG